MFILGQYILTLLQERMLLSKGISCSVRISETYSLVQFPSGSHAENLYRSGHMFLRSRIRSTQAVHFCSMALLFAFFHLDGDISGLTFWVSCVTRCFIPCSLTIYVPLNHHVSYLKILSQPDLPWILSLGCAAFVLCFFCKCNYLFSACLPISLNAPWRWSPIHFIHRCLVVPSPLPSL